MNLLGVLMATIRGASRSRVSLCSDSVVPNTDRRQPNRGRSLPLFIPRGDDTSS